MSEDTLDTASSELKRVVEGNEVPQDVEESIQEAIDWLTGDGDPSDRAANAMNVLNDVSNDPNIPMHIRTTLWNVSGDLESVSVE
ncbi:MAG: UPF0147 family protein [Halobacteria archaeon]